jgi:hypothetical protein
MAPKTAFDIQNIVNDIIDAQADGPHADVLRIDVALRLLECNGNAFMDVTAEARAQLIKLLDKIDAGEF